MKYLASLFSQPVTQEQAKFLYDQFLPLDFDAVRKATNSHRAAHEFLNFPQLVEGCRAAEREAGAGQQNGKNEGSFADIARRQCPWLKPVRDDIEVLLRKHRGWWHQCSKSDGYRSRFSSSCKHQVYDALIGRVGDDGRDDKGAVLNEISSDIMASAEAWANTIFEEPEHFRRVLDDLRSDQGRPGAVSAAHF